MRLAAFYFHEFRTLIDKLQPRLKAKFHYASWFGAGSEPLRSLFEASSELASVMEFGF